MKEMSIVSFDTNLTLFFLYFPCIILEAFSVDLLIFWSSLKASIAIGCKQVWERIVIFFVLAITCFVMLIRDLSMSNVELIIFWPPNFFWAVSLLVYLDSSLAHFLS